VTREKYVHVGTRTESADMICGESSNEIQVHLDRLGRAEQPARGALED
jgi:hypothetical protein